MTRRIKNRDLIAGFQFDLIGTDMLRDAARFAGRHIRCPQRVQQRCFTVVDMTHNRNDRRAGLAVFFVGRRIVNQEVIFDIRRRDTFTV